MQKRISLLTFITGLFLINFVSAYYGSYNFSLGNLLDSIDSSTMILGLLFIIFFAVSNFALVRAFRDNAATAGIIAFSVSLLAIYGINRSGFDYGGLFFNFGFSVDFLYIILPLLLLIASLYIIVKLGLNALLLISGGLLFSLSFTDLIYEGFTAGAIGFILIMLGLFLPSFGGWLGYRRELSEQRYGQKLGHKLERERLDYEYKLKKEFGNDSQKRPRSNLRRKRYGSR